MLEVKGIIGRVFKNSPSTYAISIKKAVVDMGILEPGKEYLITEIKQVEQIEKENSKIKNAISGFLSRNPIFEAQIPKIFSFY